MPLRGGDDDRGRYRILPGLVRRVRLDRLAFNEIEGTLGPMSWDAPVTRVEVGGGYSLQRNLLLKLSYQHNAREAGEVRTLGLLAGQLHFLVLVDVSAETGPTKRWNAKTRSTRKVYLSDRRSIFLCGLCGLCVLVS